MKAIKKISILSFVLMLCMSLFAGCSKLEKEDAVGVWSSSWTYNGNDFVCALILSDDFTYIENTSKNGAPATFEFGTYEIDGNEVKCYPRDEIYWRVYKWKNNHLVNGDHIYYKS